MAENCGVTPGITLQVWPRVFERVRRWERMRMSSRIFIHKGMFTIWGSLSSRGMLCVHKDLKTDLQLWEMNNISRYGRMIFPLSKVKIFGYISNPFPPLNGFSFNSSLSAEEKPMAGKFSVRKTIGFSVSSPSSCGLEPTTRKGSWNLAKEGPGFVVPTGQQRDWDWHT